MPSPSRLVRLSAALSTLVLAAPAFADDATDCGVFTVGDTDLVECANTNDSPGPFTPPVFSLAIQQDESGVTAMLEDGTTIDLDLDENGFLVYALNGTEADAQEVEQVLDDQLSDDEQAAVSEALANESSTHATDELVDMLGN